MKKKDPEKNKALVPAESSFLLYTTEDGGVKIGVRLENETVWLTQKSISQLFGVDTPAISKHLTHIYETGELQKEATISILETVRQEGNRHVKRNIEYYNLDAIIAVESTPTRQRSSASGPLSAFGNIS